MTRPARLQLTAVVDLQAAGATGGKSPRVSIVAYNGGVMQPAGFGPLVIELSGVTLPQQVPLLADHDANLGGIVGHGVPAIEAGALVVTGTITPTAPAAAQVLALARDGLAFNASIGLEIVSREHVRAGDTIRANGKTFTAGDDGLMHVTRGILKEVSIVAMGADASTSVSVAAAAKGSTMSFEDWLTEQGITDPASLTEDALAALRDAYDRQNGGGAGDASASGSVGLKATTERNRLREIHSIATRFAAEHPAYADTISAAANRAFDDRSVTPAHLEVELLRACRPSLNAGVRNGGANGLNGANERDTICAALMLRHNEALAVKAYGAHACEAAKRMRLNSLVDIAAAALRADHRWDAAQLPRDEMIRAAFSNESLPTILSNTVGRSLVAAYEETTTYWRTFCHVASAENFKQQTGVRPSAIQNLEEVGGTGEIKHGVIGEEATYNWQISQFAKMLGITRKTIIDDDLGFVAQLAPMLGQAAGRSLNDLIWSTIMGGETAGFFHAANHNNLMTTSSALAVGTLGSGVSAMRSQRDSQGIDIAISPVTLAVPPALELTARALLNSALLGRDDGEPTGNPVQGIVPNLAVESRLSNSDRFSGASSTQWYLFGPPTSRPVTVGFLQNTQTPTVEVENAPFNMLGIQLRVVFDYGCALSDPKAALKATGAGGG